MKKCAHPHPTPPQWPMLAMLQGAGPVRLLSGCCGLSPSTSFCIWFVSSPTLRVLLSVSAVWRPSCLLRHPTRVSRLVSTFSFRVCMLLVGKTSRGDEVFRASQRVNDAALLSLSADLNCAQSLLSIVSLHFQHPGRRTHPSSVAGQRAQ